MLKVAEVLADRRRTQPYLCLLTTTFSGLPKLTSLVAQIRSRHCPHAWALAPADRNVIEVQAQFADVELFNLPEC